MTKLSDLANENNNKSNKEVQPKPKKTYNKLTEEEPKKTYDKLTEEEAAKATEPEKESVTELTDEQIEKWKKEHGKIYKITFDDQDIVWRRLRRKEYIEALNIEGNTEDESIYLRQDAIALSVTLYPDNIEQLIEGAAGLSGQISDQAVSKSGFKHIEAEEL